MMQSIAAASNKATAKLIGFDPSASPSLIV